MSVSIENFLKNIYLLNQEVESQATSSLLANRLDVSVAAVTDMARKLGKQGLLDYRPYRALMLSEEGEKRALSVIRKHRLWELFLYRVLKMDLMRVHEEAEKLEHHTSDDLIEKIYRYLGEPDFDPHGDPIPGISGEVPGEEDIMALSKASEGHSYCIRKLRYRDNETSEMYDRYGLKQGLLLSVKKIYGFDGSIEIETIDGENAVISKKLASNIFVESQAEQTNI